MEAILAHPNQGVLIEKVNGDMDALRRLIVETINKEGSIQAAAKALGVRHGTLNYWRKRLDISVEITAKAE